MEKVKCRDCEHCNIFVWEFLEGVKPWYFCSIIDKMEETLGIDREEWPGCIEISIMAAGGEWYCPQFIKKEK